MKTPQEMQQMKLDRIEELQQLSEPLFDTSNKKLEEVEKQIQEEKDHSNTGIPDLFQELRVSSETTLASDLEKWITNLEYQMFIDFEEIKKAIDKL